MTFDKITENEKLWAVRYEGCVDNVLDTIFCQWNDVTWLRDFFKANIGDLASYFKLPMSIRQFMTQLRTVNVFNV